MRISSAIGCALFGIGSCAVGSVWSIQGRQLLWAEILAAARTVGALAANERLFKAVSAASAAGDAVKLADALRIPDFQWRCHFICEFFCSWRCVLLCPIYARPFPYAAIKAAAQIREAQAVCRDDR
jgi:hypothetical protein